MKTLLYSFVFGLVALALVGAASGCSGSSKPKVDLQAQLNALKSGDAAAKADALANIAMLQEDAAPALSELVAALKDADGTVRSLAAYAIGQIGPDAKSAVPNLREALRDRDSNVIAAALNAIRAIDPDAPESKAMIPNIRTGE